MVKKHSNKHIVIVGGGFAGIKSALELSKRNVSSHITLISDEPFFLHHATLYSTATGKNRAESVVPLAMIFANHPNVTVVQAEVTGLEAEKKLVMAGKHQFKYDYLVIGIGLVNNYFGIKGMDKHSFGIKTLEEVNEFTNHIQEEIVEKKQLDKNYVVVGAGPTGVELAGALREYIDELILMHRIKGAKTTVSLVEASPRILPNLSKTASSKVTRRLEKIGVKVVTHQRVELLEDDYVVISGKKIPSETVIWTAGVKNHPFFAKYPEYFNLNRIGRVEVDQYLSPYKDIFVIGDNNDTRYSGMAWPALANGVFVARHIERLVRKQPVKKYKASGPPSGVPIGSDWAYVEWHGIYASGKTGYLFRRWMELYGYKQLLPRKIAVAAWRSHDLPETDPIK